MSRQVKLLKKENEELEKQLSKENEELQTDMVVYIRSPNISDMDQELVRRDITQMLIDGQNRGVGAAEVIGDDYKAFCDNVMIEIPKLSTKMRILTVIRDIIPALIVLIGIWVVFGILKQCLHGEAWYLTPLSVFDLIIGAAMLLIASLSVVYITRNSFSLKPTVEIGIILVVIAAVVCCALFVKDKTLFAPSVFSDAVLAAALYIAYRSVDKKL